MKSYLVATKDLVSYRIAHECLGTEDSVTYAESKEAAMEALQQQRFDVLLIDVSFVSQTESERLIQEAFQQFWHLRPAIHIIVMIPPHQVRLAVMAVKAGASNYLTQPLTAVEVQAVTEATARTLQDRGEREYQLDQFWHQDSLQVVKTDNPIMQRIFGRVRSVAPTKSTVLLIGETGTGKGVLAKLIHRHSSRKDGPFISVHCGAIPETLRESELFGHEKGAFTGAIRKKLGKFEIAEGGTIFLDEIGTIPPSAQIKLLQVLQDGTFSRVGGEDSIQADVRIIAATNADLKAMSDDGQFRNDLYYRLNVFPLEIPPLRDRLEDLSFLVASILARLNRQFSKDIKGVHPQVVEAFQWYEWPGNIRELENLLERACILESSSVLTVGSFPEELFAEDRHLASVPVDSSLTLAEARNQALEDFERRYLNALLARHRGKINESAESAGVSTRQLHKLMTKYSIKKEEYKHSSMT